MQYTTDMNEGIHAETVTMLGANGDRINAFLARPLGDGKFPAMVLAHHMPGWDLLYREFTYKFAHHRLRDHLAESCTSARGMGRPKTWRQKYERREACRTSPRSRRSGGRGKISQHAAIRQRQDRNLRHVLRRTSCVSRGVPHSGVQRRH
jgi:hypothetical protein